MNKKTLIIIPGWGGSHETWSDFVVLAKPHFGHVICLDLPCFGGNPCPKTVWGVEHYAEYVRRKIERIKEDEMKNGGNTHLILLGHSFGGQVLTYLVAKNKGICDKLILSGAAVYRKKRGLKEIFFFLIAKFGKIVLSIPLLKNFQKIAKKILYKLSDSPDYEDTSGIKREIFQRVIRQDVSSNLKDITCPTLVLWGESDSYVPLSSGKKIAAELSTSELKVFANAGHGLHLQKPAEFLEAIREFINK